MSDIDISIYPANSQKHVKYSSLFIDPKFRRRKKKSYMEQRHQDDHVLKP